MWIKCSDRMPKLGSVVETKIDDEKGERNIAKLKTYQRTPETRVMWFLPDDSMYVYYTPTHWRES